MCGSQSLELLFPSEIPTPPLPQLLFVLIGMSVTGCPVKGSHDNGPLRKWKVKSGQFELLFVSQRSGEPFSSLGSKGKPKYLLS